MVSINVRRGHQVTVSIRQRKNAYYLSYNYYTPDGVRRQKCETVYSYEDAVQRKKALEYQQTVRQLSSTPQITFLELYEQFLQYHAGVRYKPSTYRNFKQQMEMHIIPELGNQYVHDIRPVDIERLLYLLRNKHGRGTGQKLSTSSIASLYSCIRQCFNAAVRWQYIQVSPVTCAKPPVHHDTVEIWQPDTMKQVLAAMRQENELLLELCVHIGYVCSARAGEIAGITWDRVDPQACTVMITHQLQRVYIDSLQSTSLKLRFVFPSHKIGAKTVLALTSPKNKSSVRIIKVPRHFMDCLMERKREYEHQREINYGEFQDYNLVVANEYGLPVEPGRINEMFQDFLSRHDEIPQMRFHGIRHSSASYKLVLSNGDFKSVQAHTGHSSTKMMMDTYGHVMPLYSSALTDKFEQDFYEK